MKKIILLTLSVSIWFFVAAATAGIAQQIQTGTKLIIGTKEAPPFVIKRPHGGWEGVSIELWRSIASKLDLAYEFRERDLKGLIDGVEDGTLQLSIAALTITPAREARLDFSHPYFTTGLGIAVSKRARGGWLAVGKRFFSIEFLTVLGILALVLLGTGFLVWIFERRRNPDQFGGPTAKGIGSGFWWSAVTMTTVGYGDKAPVTVGGRVVALIWMFVAIIIISGFTAAITSSLTVSKLEGAVKGLEDLPNVRTATAKQSTSAAFLEMQNIPHRRFETIEQGLSALVDGQIDAFIYDAPILQFLAKSKFSGEIEVLPETFDRQDYGIALPTGSPLREPINRALLEQIRSPEWRLTLSRYLGS